jgi:hypothetical protein
LAGGAVRESWLVTIAYLSKGVIRAHDIPVRQHEAQQRASFGSGIERKIRDRHGSTCQLIGKPYPCNLRAQWLTDRQ